MQLRKSTKNATVASKNAAEQAAALVEANRVVRQSKRPKRVTEFRVRTTRQTSRAFLVLADYTLESDGSDIGIWSWTAAVNRAESKYMTKQ